MKLSFLLLVAIFVVGGLTVINVHRWANNVKVKKTCKGHVLVFKHPTQFVCAPTSMRVSTD
jgi:hypothetical protein